MAPEHSPKPGVTWQQQPAVVEAMAPEEPDEQPRLNREQRRALQRARRRKGGRR